MQEATTVEKTTKIQTKVLHIDGKPNPKKRHKINRQKFHLKINRLEKAKFDYWVKQFLIKLYISIN